MTTSSFWRNTTVMLMTMKDPVATRATKERQVRQGLWTRTYQKRSKNCWQGNINKVVRHRFKPTLFCLYYLNHSLDGGGKEGTDVEGLDDQEDDDFGQIKVSDKHVKVIALGHSSNLKVFYASRTHSQLSQFINEVRKTKHAENIWSVSLGSRKNLCINKKVNSLGSVHRINEACLDLQKKGTYKRQSYQTVVMLIVTSSLRIRIDKERCAYLPAQTEKGLWQKFEEHALVSEKMKILLSIYWPNWTLCYIKAHTQDIEDLYKTGKHLNICPYYGSRQTTKPAQVQYRFVGVNYN